jgi:hypothetical protein
MTVRYIFRYTHIYNRYTRTNEYKCSHGWWCVQIDCHNTEFGSSIGGKRQRLVGGRDSDGLALGVVEAVVGLDVEDHAKSPGEDERQNGSGEDGRQNRNREKIAAVVSVVEPFFEVIRLNLKINSIYFRALLTNK